MRIILYLIINIYFGSSCYCTSHVRLYFIKKKKTIVIPFQCSHSCTYTWSHKGGKFWGEHRKKINKFKSYCFKPIGCYKLFYVFNFFFSNLSTFKNINCITKTQLSKESNPNIYLFKINFKGKHFYKQSIKYILL